MTRTTTSLGIGLSALAGIGLFAYIRNRRAMPRWRGVERLGILSAPARILRDRWGVPAVFASNELDAYRIQGWLHGSDRTLQLDLLRRAGTGTLAQLIGESGIANDKLIRTLGFHTQIRDEVEILEPNERAMLEAYAQGVNAAFKRSRRRVPLEYCLLRARPTVWRIEDSLAVQRVLALSLAANWESEIVRSEIAAVFGREVLEVLMSIGGAETPARGSNAWAINANRSISGGALLAADPHLDLAIPSIWYEQRIQGGELDARGFTIPGVPGILKGHNQDVAWAFTNAPIDTQDCYVELIDETTSTYRDTDGLAKPLTLREETISVRGGQDVQLTVRSTRRGPILDGALFESRAANDNYSLRWDALKPGRSISALLRASRARNADELVNAFSEWTTPTLLLTYADSRKEIGSVVIGRVPKRGAKHAGMLPKRGDDPHADWEGVYPAGEVGALKNPPSGVVVNANSRPQELAEGVAGEWLNPYREQRIAQLLMARSMHDPRAQLRIQRDTYSLHGVELRDLYKHREISCDDSAGRRILADFLAWDGELVPQSAGANAYLRIDQAIHDLLFDFLGDHYSTTHRARYPRKANSTMVFARARPEILRAIHANDTALLALGARAESWEALLTKALEHAGAAEQIRKRPPQTLRLQHALSRIPGVDRIASRKTFALPGDADTVWQSTPIDTPLSDFGMVGPSLRMVVDLGDLDASLAVLCGGQSGHPASPHYADQVDVWRRGALRPAPFSEEAITKLAVYYQQLIP